MMELRKVKKAVEKYETLLVKDQENAKRYKNEYAKDIEILLAVVETYLNDAAKELQIWCNTMANVFQEPTNNFWQRTKRAIDMAVVNHYFNGLSKRMFQAGNLQTRLKKIQQRFVQYQYFCLH